jgi:hypothetical protein
MDHSRLHQHTALVMIPAIVLACSAMLVMGRDVGASLGRDGAQVLGNWSGQSICQVKNSPCHDEKVVYHITSSKDPGKVTVTADKIVDGRPITMGSGDYDYDNEKGTLVNESSRGIWRLVIRANTMEGTLTLPDKTLYRRISLTKDDK